MRLQSTLTMYIELCTMHITDGAHFIHTILKFNLCLGHIKVIISDRFKRNAVLPTFYPYYYTKNSTIKNSRH